MIKTTMHSHMWGGLVFPLPLCNICSCLQDFLALTGLRHFLRCVTFITHMYSSSMEGHGHRFIACNAHTFHVEYISYSILFCFICFRVGNWVYRWMGSAIAQYCLANEDMSTPSVQTQKEPTRRRETT